MSDKERDQLHHVVRNNTCVILSQVRKLTRNCCPNNGNCEFIHTSDKRLELEKDIFDRLKEIEIAVS